MILFAVSYVTGKSFRVSAQKWANNGAFEDEWNFTDGEFVSPGAGSFTDRSIAMEEGASEKAGSYTVILPKFEDYNGQMILRVHDTDDSNITKQSVTIELLDGELVTQETATQVSRVNYPVADPFVFRMSRRGDGTVKATNKIFVHPDDEVAIAFDLSRIFPRRLVEVVGTPSSSGAMGVERVGPRDTMAVIQIDGSQVAGQTYEVAVNATMDNGDRVRCIGEVACVV